MKYRPAILIVVYNVVKNKPKYLLLKRKLHWKGWEFPKGGKKHSETDLMTLKRELKEETGLTPIKIKSFKEKGKYNYPKEYADRKGFKGQTYKLYSAEVKKEKVKLDKLEHSNYQWLPFDKAVKKLTWPNQKRLLGMVDEELQEIELL